MPTGSIEDLQDGFIVEISGLGTRRPTRVSLEPTGFRVEPLARPAGAVRRHRASVQLGTARQATYDPC